MPDLDLTYILAGSFGPDAVVLQHVETRERAKCLRARGFDVPEETPPVSLSSDLYSIYRRLDPDFVKEAGYGILLKTSPLAASGPPSVIEEFVSKLNEEENATFGSADSLCSSEVRSLIFTDFDHWDEVRTQLERIRNDYILEVQASDAVQALNKEWASCMEERGFTFNGPDSVVTQLSARANADTLDLKTELATAEADLACRARVRFEERYWQLYQVGEVALVEKHAQLIADVRSAKYDKVLAMVEGE